MAASENLPTAVSPHGAVSKGVVHTEEEKALIIETVMGSGFTMAECKVAIAASQALGLNMLAKQIYPVKYDGHMVLQVGIDGYRLVSSRTKNYAGVHNARLVVKDKKGEVKEIEHKFYDPDEHPTIVSASIEVHLKDGSPPQEGVAHFKTYAKYYNGKLGKSWASMPDVMILKCAEAQAHRKAFPNDGPPIYVDAEMEQAQNDATITVTATETKTPPERRPQARQRAPRTPVPPTEPEEKPADPEEAAPNEAIFPEQDDPQPEDPQPEQEAAKDAPPEDAPPSNPATNGREPQAASPDPEMVAVYDKWFDYLFKSLGLTDDGFKAATEIIRREFQVSDHLLISPKEYLALKSFLKTGLMKELKNRGFLKEKKEGKGQ